LQILEDSGKILVIPVSWPADTGYTSITDIGRLGTKLRNVLVFFVLSVMKGRTVNRETGRKETRGGRKEKREGRKVKRSNRNCRYWKILVKYW
jgi:hypothetical protein